MAVTLVLPVFFSTILLESGSLPLDVSSLKRSPGFGTGLVFVKQVVKIFAFASELARPAAVLLDFPGNVSGTIVPAKLPSEPPVKGQFPGHLAHSSFFSKCCSWPYLLKRWIQ
jgi:hypothetical protein